MAQRNVTLDAIATPQEVGLGGILNSLLVVNTGTLAGQTVDIILAPSQGDDALTLNPGDNFELRAEDTSAKNTGSKVYTDFIRLTGNTVSATVVQLVYTLKSTKPHTVEV